MAWAEEQKEAYHAGILYTAYDRDGLVLELANLIAEFKVPVKSFNLRSMSDHTAAADIMLQINNKQQLDSIIKRLRNLKGTIDVKRAASKKENL